MHINQKFRIILIIFLVVTACKEEPHQGLGDGMPSYCAISEIIATSKKCECNISFADYLDYTDNYTFTSIESYFSEIGQSCNQSIFKVKYMNSVHDHNEPDYEFGFRLPKLSPEQFFTIDTFAIDTIDIFESRRTGGHGGPIFDADVMLIWDSVNISDGIYWGSGKFIFNDSIPSTFPNYFWPEQEVRFEFCKK